MTVLPFLPRLPIPSAATVRAGALEVAILAGHVLLYPTGLSQEQCSCELIDPSEEPAKAPAPPPSPGDGTRPPVLLLHGFIDNRSVFVLLRRSLRRHGWPHVEGFNFSPLSCDIRNSAEVLGRHIEEVCARTGHDRIDVVGHSLGGLIGRYYAQRMDGHHRVRRLVTLGTPHAGTRAIPLMTLHPLVRQMRPDSEVIEELAGPATGCSTHFISFWSDFDQFMSPVETAALDHPDLITHNIQVSGVGHLALPVHSAVDAGIREVLSAKALDRGVSDRMPVPELPSGRG